MTEPEKKWDAAEEFPGEQTPKEAPSDRPDTEPSTSGGKAPTAPAEQITRCATDTIDDGDGSYLEPPD
ncbi:MAG: hypothetical protein ACJ8AT_13135 [Hyalangium sp.]|uniref:hypothetical protein n=1 Tax=Hyalangium sp. TaxID=2028555 RepID=UPI00389B1D9F